MQNGPDVERVSGPESGRMKPDEKRGLERVLDSAAVVSWADLMGSAQTGLITLNTDSLRAALWIM